MAQIGSKQNSFLNGEWAKHGRGDGKRQAAAVRRMMGKEEIRVTLAMPDYRMDGVDGMGTFDDYHNDGWNHWMYVGGDTSCADKYLEEENKVHLYKLEELCILKKAA